VKKEESRFAKSTLFEGMVSLRALIEATGSGASDRRIITLYYDRARAEKESKELAWLRHRGEEMGFAIELTDRAVLDDMAIGSSHGGVIAACTERTLPPLSADVLSGKGVLFLLDGVEDPYNFGYALRSLYAMGVDGIILGERNWMSAAGVVCRASAGASERMPLYLAQTEEAIDLLHGAGYTVAAADLRSAVPCDKADLKPPLAVLVGGEKRGIASRVLDKCDVRICIDYGREFPQSLSAASAATILGYEILRQKRAKNA